MLATERKERIYDLIKKQKAIRTAQEYADLLGVSKRTVYSDLKEIKKELHKNGYELNSISGKGFDIKQIAAKNSPDEESELNLKNITDERRLEIMESLLFGDEPLNINSLSEKYYVSPSSIKNDVNKLIETYTDEYTAKIVVNHQTIKIEGNEELIQALFVRFNEECLKKALLTYTDKQAEILKKYYGKTIVEKSFEFINNSDKADLVFIANHYKANVLNILMVLLYRASKGKNISFTEESLYLDEIMNLPNMILSKEILSKASKELNIHLSAGDYRYFADRLKANRVGFGSSQNMDQENLDAINRIIIKMSDCLNIDIFKYTNIVRNIVVHLDAMFYRLKNNIIIRNPLIDQIKQEFRVMFELTWMVLDSECSSLNINLTEDEVGFALIHFQNVADIEHKSKKVLVICPNGAVSSQLVANRLRNILPPLEVVETADFEKTKRSNLNSFDFIVSTAEISIPNINIPVLYVSLLIGEEDIKNINTFYTSTFLSDRETDENKFPKLSKLVSPELVFINSKAIKRDELIEKVVSKLQDNGYVMDGYYKSVVDREALGGTDTNFLAAIPHGEIKYVKRTGISIWINKSPIKWTNHNVKVAIFLCISKEDLKQCKIVLEDVYRLIKSKRFINLISREDVSKEDIMEFIGLDGIENDTERASICK